MLETIGGFLSQISNFIAIACGLAAAYFLYVTLREWRVKLRAAFGVERDIAQSEMVGSVIRAAIFVSLGVAIFGLGWLGGQAKSEEPDSTTPPQAQTTAQATQPPTLQPGETAQIATATIELPTLPPELGETAAPLPIEATPQLSPTPAGQQRARVSVYGGVWLRDAPNGGTIVVLLQETNVDLLEGHEFAGNEDWQKVRVTNVPPGSEAQVGQEGWVAHQYLEISP